MDAKELDIITQYVRIQRYNKALENLENLMETCANNGETFVYWDNLTNGQLRASDITNFRRRGFEVVEIRDELSEGYKIEWEV